MGLFKAFRNEKMSKIKVLFICHGRIFKTTKSIVYFVVNRYQVNRMKERVHDIDSGAYIIMSEVVDIFSNNIDKA